MRTAKEICASVQNLNAEAVELAEQVLFLREKLARERERLADEPLVITYDNGGGQSGIRENPEIVAYEKLLSSYMKALKQLREIVGDEIEVKAASLEDFRARFKVAK